METRQIDVQLIRIDVDVLQEAIDYAALNDTTGVVLMFFKGKCLGIDTATVSPASKTRKPRLSVIPDEPTPRASRKAFGDPPPPGSEGKPFDRNTLYALIKEHGPISTINIGDMLEIGRKQNVTRAKVSQLIGSMKKEGLVSTKSGQHKTTAKAFKKFVDRRKAAPKAKAARNTTNIKTIQAITAEDVLDVLRKAKDPMKTIEICDAMNLDRSKNGIRSKVTKLLRQNLYRSGLITVAEKAGGHSTYQIASDDILPLPGRAVNQ